MNPATLGRWEFCLYLLVAVLLLVQSVQDVVAIAVQNL